MDEGLIAGEFFHSYVFTRNAESDPDVNNDFNIKELLYLVKRGLSGVAMASGKGPMPKRPTNLDNSGASAYCTCSRCG